jgi:hypothetical protein
VSSVEDAGRPSDCQTSAFSPFSASCQWSVRLALAAGSVVGSAVAGPLNGVDGVPKDVGELDGLGTSLREAGDGDGGPGLCDGGWRQKKRQSGPPSRGDQVDRPHFALRPYHARPSDWPA